MIHDFLNSRGEVNSRRKVISGDRSRPCDHPNVGDWESRSKTKHGDESGTAALEVLGRIYGEAMETALDGPPVELPPRAQFGPGPATVSEGSAVDPVAVGDAEAESGVPDQSLAQRAAAVRTTGAELQTCCAAGPPMPTSQTPLRARVWVAADGQTELRDIYSKWSGGAQLAAEGDLVCYVAAFASLAEAEAFAAGVGGQIPDRRR